MSFLLVSVSARHKSVMVQEVLEALELKSGHAYIDCTLGEGGHSVAILNADPKAHLLGIDLDIEALAVAKHRLESHRNRISLIQGNFADLENFANKNGFEPANGILFDLGLSSLQVETGTRGFSFRQEARLDMRFGPTQEVTAYQVVNEFSENSLADLIYHLGEEPKARRVARAIVRNRPIETTTHLAAVIARAIGRAARTRTHSATRTFQALRMTVNKELDNLFKGLHQAIKVLGTGGRLVVISYHSIEDRLVKTSLRREASGCTCTPGTPVCICGHTPTIRLITRRVTKPTGTEVNVNPRSRSARMRVAERI